MSLKTPSRIDSLNALDAIIHFSKLVTSAVRFRSSSNPSSADRSLVPITKHFREFVDLAISYAFTIDRAVSIITHILISLDGRCFSKFKISFASFIFGIKTASGWHFLKISKSFFPSSVS